MTTPLTTKHQRVSMSDELLFKKRVTYMLLVRWRLVSHKVELRQVSGGHQQGRRALAQAA